MSTVLLTWESPGLSLDSFSASVSNAAGLSWLPCACCNAEIVSFHHIALQLGVPILCKVRQTIDLLQEILLNAATRRDSMRNGARTRACAMRL